MANSQETFTWTSNPLTLSFDVLRDKYLSVTVAGTPTTQWTLNGRELTLTGTVVNGSEVVVTRSTDVEDDQFLVQFTDASSLRAEDLDTATTQLLHILQEIIEGNQAAVSGFYLPLDTSRAFWDGSGGGASNLEVRNVADPTVAQAAATKNYVDAQISGTGQVPATTNKVPRATGQAQRRLCVAVPTARFRHVPLHGRWANLWYHPVDQRVRRCSAGGTSRRQQPRPDRRDAGLCSGWTQIARTRDASMEAFATPVSVSKLRRATRSSRLPLSKAAGTSASTSWRVPARPKARPTGPRQCGV